MIFLVLVNTETCTFTERLSTPTRTARANTEQLRMICYVASTQHTFEGSL